MIFNIRHPVYGKLISRKLDRYKNMDRTDAEKSSQFGIGFPCWIYYFDRIHFVCCSILCGHSCLCWMIRIEKCILACHGFIIADALIIYVHRTMSPCMCIDVHQCIAALPRVPFQNKKLNLFQ